MKETHIKKTAGSIIIYALIYAFLLFVLVITVFPVLYSFFSSFKTNQDILTGGIKLIPEKFVFENYKQAWVLADFKRYTWNSIYMTFCIVVITLTTSSMGGYVFSRGKFPGKKIIFTAFTGTMFVSLGSIGIYPLLQIAKFFHINNTLWGVIIISVFGVNITNMYLVRGFVDSLPIELDESAKIDGCNFFQLFLWIILPLLKPIMATIGILTFKGAWNNYLLPMIFTMANPRQAPLIVGIVALKRTSEAATAWNLMLAGTMISVIPMLIVYLILNKYFVRGLVSGAVKG